MTNRRTADRASRDKTARSCAQNDKGSLAADEGEEVVGADLAAFEDEFEVVERAVRVGAAERDAGLEVGCPGEGVEAELLDGVRGGVSSAEHDAAHGSGGAREDVAEEKAKGGAEVLPVGGGFGRAERGVKDSVVTGGERLGSCFESGGTGEAVWIGQGRGVEWNATEALG